MKSRYIPFTQQPYCCVPACLQMVMYKKGIKLLPQEEIGYELGLTVPEEEAYLFEKVHLGPKPPAGWGTRISDPKFEINGALKRLAIDLHVNRKLINDISSPNELKKELADIERADGDALVCFNYGKLWDTDSSSGHLNVFDRIEGNDVWLVDPVQKVPKYRKADAQEIYDSMVYHGADKGAGIWIINKN